MLTIAIAVAALVLFLGADLASGEEVVVFPALVTNLDEAEGRTIGAAMAQVYAEASGKSVAGPPRITLGAGDGSDEIDRQVREFGASEYVRMTAVKLQNKTLIEARLSTADGAVLHQARMASASIDDVADVCARLARALVERVSAQDAQALGTIAKSETVPGNRLFVERIIGVKTSLLYSLSGKYREPMGALAAHLKLEGGRHFLECGIGALSPTYVGYDARRPRYGGVVADLGWAYYLIDSDRAAPFAGGGLSPRMLFVPGTFVAAPYAQFGLMFLRRSSTRLFVAARATQNVLPITLQNRAGDMTVKAYPLEVGLDVGIGW